MMSIIHYANDLKLDRCIYKARLSITTETNLRQLTDFLDVTFNLSRGKYFPCNRPSNTPVYIHAKSNHLPFFTNQLPKMNNKRISDLFYDESAFNNAKKKKKKKKKIRISFKA